MIDFEKIIGNIKSRNDFIEFVGILMRDFQDNKAEWENKTLDSYLEAIQSCTEDLDGYYINNDLPVPENVQWEVFANILITAKMYE